MSLNDYLNQLLEDQEEILDLIVPEEINNNEALLIKRINLSKINKIF